MKSPGKLFRVAVVVGAVFAAGPIFGFLATMYGMSRSFTTLGRDGLTDQRALADNVALSLHATQIGLALCPVGVAILVAALVWRARTRRDEPPPLPPTNFAP